MRDHRGAPRPPPRPRAAGKAEKLRSWHQQRRGTQEYSHYEDSEDQVKKSRMTGKGISRGSRSEGLRVTVGVRSKKTRKGPRVT